MKKLVATLTRPNLHSEEVVSPTVPPMTTGLIAPLSRPFSELFLHVFSTTTWMSLKLSMGTARPSHQVWYLTIHNTSTLLPRPSHHLVSSQSELPFAFTLASSQIMSYPSSMLLSRTQPSRGLSYPSSCFRSLVSTPLSLSGTSSQTFTVLTC